MEGGRAGEARMDACRAVPLALRATDRDVAWFYLLVQM